MSGYGIGNHKLHAMAMITMSSPHDRTESFPLRHQRFSNDTTERLQLEGLPQGMTRTELFRHV